MGFSKQFHFAGGFFITIWHDNYYGTKRSDYQDMKCLKCLAFSHKVVQDL